MFQILAEKKYQGKLSKFQAAVMVSRWLKVCEDLAPQQCYSQAMQNVPVLDKWKDDQWLGPLSGKVRVVLSHQLVAILLHRRLQESPLNPRSIGPTRHEQGERRML